MAKKTFNLIKEMLRGFMLIDNDKPSMYSYSGKKSKTYLTRNETLQLKGNMNKKISEINDRAKELFKEHYKNLDKILELIAAQGTPVIKSRHMEKVLFLLGESEGFILPQDGLRALFLTVMINILTEEEISVGFKSPAMFIMRDLPLNFYFFAHQFHHWLSYTSGLGGYDKKASSNFKSIFHPEFGTGNIKRMSIHEIMSLKEAIARDSEAIQFVKEISREIVGSEKFIERLKKGESLNL